MEDEELRFLYKSVDDARVLPKAISRALIKILSLDGHYFVQGSSYFGISMKFQITIQWQHNEKIFEAISLSCLVLKFIRSASQPIAPGEY